MDPHTRRLITLLGHFPLQPAAAGPNAVSTAYPATSASGGPGATTAFSPAELQALLDHDNWAMREQMKEFMRDEVFIPWVYV